MDTITDELIVVITFSLYYYYSSYFNPRYLIPMKNIVCILISAVRRDMFSTLISIGSWENNFDVVT